jgi:hypothetical protein
MLKNSYYKYTFIKLAILKQKSHPKYWLKATTNKSKYLGHPRSKDDSWPSEQAKKAQKKNTPFLRCLGERILN